MTIDQLKASLSLDNVQRWQKHRKDNKKAVAIHAYKAALLYAYLGGKDIISMLTHDNDEVFTGDIPSPAKKHIRGLEYFKKACVPFSCDYEKKLGKIADLLELVLELKEDLEQYGHLPKNLRSVYRQETKKLLQLAKAINKDKEVKYLLKEVVK